MRQIILDTETTGLEPEAGHRIIEIGCVELINRRPSGNNYHQYLQPDREIDEGALEVHGITQAFLADKPRFTDVARDFLDYVKDAELIIHNAPFDVGFLNHELALLGEELGRIEDYCSIIDTLKMARSMHPGQSNSLDALCKRYNIDNSQRTLHGALLDAEILADVYLVISGGQTALFADVSDVGRFGVAENAEIRRTAPNRSPLPIIRADAEELSRHAAWVEEIERKSGGNCLWKRLDEDSVEE